MNDINIWFNSLNLEQLMRLFYCPFDRDANDFIDDCDEYWENLNEEEKWSFYQRFA